MAPGRVRQVALRNLEVDILKAGDNRMLSSAEMQFNNINLSADDGIVIANHPGHIFRGRDLPDESRSQVFGYLSRDPAAATCSWHARTYASPEQKGGVIERGR